MTLHTFSLTIDWPGGRNAVGDLKAERLANANFNST